MKQKGSALCTETVVLLLSLSGIKCLACAILSKCPLKKSHIVFKAKPRAKFQLGKCVSVHLEPSLIAS